MLWQHVNKNAVILNKCLNHFVYMAYEYVHHPILVTALWYSYYACVALWNLYFITRFQTSAFCVVSNLFDNASLALDIGPGYITRFFSRWCSWSFTLLIFACIYFIREFTFVTMLLAIAQCHKDYWSKQNNINVSMNIERARLISRADTCVSYFNIPLRRCCVHQSPLCCANRC